MTKCDGVRKCRCDGLGPWWVIFPPPSPMFFDLLACPMGVSLLVLGLYIIHITCVEFQMHSWGQVSHNTLPCSPSHHPPSHSSQLCCRSTQAYLLSPYIPPSPLPTILPGCLYLRYHPIATPPPPRMSLFWHLWLFFCCQMLMYASPTCTYIIFY